jgi:uncharacterized protein YkvS
MDITLALIDLVVIPEVLGRTIDLALVFVAEPEEKTNVPLAGSARGVVPPRITPPEEQEKAATVPFQMNVDLSRAALTFVALDGADIATLHLDGMKLTRETDASGLSTLSTRIAEIAMIDRLHPQTEFPKIIESRRGNVDSSQSAEGLNAPNSFVEVHLRDIAPASQQHARMEGVPKQDCPRFTSDCRVAISEIVLFYVPDVLKEIQAAIGRAGAVMSNLDKTKKRAADATSQAAASQVGKEQMRLSVTMAQPTLVLVRDVADPKTVSITPGNLSVSNQFDVKGNRAFQVYNAVVSDMRVTALGTPVLKQTAACDLHIAMDLTERNTPPPQAAGASTGSDEHYGTIAEVELPPLRADISDEQFAFLLGFAAAMTSAEVRPLEDKPKATAAHTASPQPKPVKPRYRPKPVTAERQRSPEPDIVDVPTPPARTHVKLKWTGADIRLEELFEVRVDNLNVNAVMTGNVSVINVTASGVSMMHQTAPFFRLEGLTAGVTKESAAEQHQHQHQHHHASGLAPVDEVDSTEITADLGLLDVVLTPIALKAAVKHIYDPTMRHYLRTPTPGPLITLEDAHVYKAACDLRPTLENYIFVSHRNQLCTYVLDLQRHQLDLTSTGQAGPLIVLQDNTRLRIINGSIKLPGYFSIRSFVSYGFNTVIEFDPNVVPIERTKLNHNTPALQDANRTAFSTPGVTPEQSTDVLEASLVKPKPSNALKIGARLNVQATICDDDRRDPIGIAFKTEVSLQQRSNSHGELTQRAVSVGVRDLSDVNGEVLMPTELSVRVTGTSEVNISAECQKLVLTIRYQRAMYITSVLKRIGETLPKAASAPYSSTVNSTLEDNSGRLLTRRSVLRDCSVCGQKNAAPLGAGTSGRLALASSTHRRTRSSVANLAEDEADVYICVPCACGRRSLEHTSVNLDVPALDATIIGSQGEMLQLCASGVSLAMDQDTVKASLEFNVWTSNPYCGQWEALVERAKVKVQATLSQSSYVVDIPVVEANITGDMLRSVRQFQEDVSEVMAADNAVWSVEAQLAVTNWTEHSLRVDGQLIRPRGQQTFKLKSRHVELDTSDAGMLTGISGVFDPDASPKHTIAIDRSAVFAADPFVVDVCVKDAAGTQVAVDIIPVHSVDGIVKVQSMVPQDLMVLGSGCVNALGSLFLGRDTSVDNAFVLQPFGVTDDEYEIATPVNTVTPIIRKLLNGEEFKLCAKSKSRRNVALHYRVRARNVGMSVGVPRFDITISGGFSFTNHLPHTVQVDWVGAENHVLARSEVRSNGCEEITIADAACGRVKVRFTITERDNLYESKVMDLVEGRKRLPLHTVTNGERREMAIMITTAADKMELSAPFYVVNHALIPFEMSIVGDERAQMRNWATLGYSQDTAVVVTPPIREEDQEPELMVRLTFQNAQSGNIPLHATGRTGQIALVNENGDSMHFTYSTDFTDATFTSRTVIITPRWVIVNRTNYPLVFAQDMRQDTTFNMSLKPGKAIGYFSMQKPPNGYGYRMCVSRKPKENAGTGTVRRRDVLCASRRARSGESGRHRSNSGDRETCWVGYLRDGGRDHRPWLLLHQPDFREGRARRCRSVALPSDVRRVRAGPLHFQ